MTWRLALLYERQELSDSFGIQLGTSRRRGGGTERGGPQRQLDQDGIAVGDQQASRPLLRAAAPGDQQEPAAEQRVGRISDLDLLRIGERS
jgi:hypothetical protein